MSSYQHDHCGVCVCVCVCVCAYRQVTVFIPLDWHLCELGHRVKHHSDVRGQGHLENLQQGGEFLGLGGQGVNDCHHLHLYTTLRGREAEHTVGGCVVSD